MFADHPTATRVAHYRIEGELGRGGMGVVHRAVDDRLGRPVALKLIAAEQAADEMFRRRFLAESKAAAAVDHPHVLPVYEAGEDGGNLFLVTRLVEGTDLRGLLREEGPLDARRALTIAGQVGAALDAAHERGLVHRDVKPANVLVVPDGRPGGGDHCYLTDFGLAKQAGQNTGLTQTGQLVGTLDYVAPEQIEGRAVDGRADVYALGALLYECLAGSPPFRRDTHVALIWAHLNEPLPSLSERCDGVAPELDAALAHAMAKDADARPATCAAFVAEAEAALSRTRPQGDDRPTAAAGTDATVASAAPARETAAAQETAPAGRDAPPTAAPPTRRRPPRAVLAGLALALLTAVAVAALVVLSPFGGSGSSESADGSRVPAAAIEVSTETVALLAETTAEGRGLADAIAGGEPAGGGETASIRRRAAALTQRADDELPPDTPGRGALTRSLGGIADVTRTLDSIRAAPDSSESSPAARRARRQMVAVVGSLDAALVEFRDSLEAEGAGDAVAAVEAGLGDLRASERRITTVFDGLIDAVR